MMFDDTGGSDLLKVSVVRSSQPLSKSAAFATLSRFLKTEQQKQDPGAIQHSHWEDLYHVSETLVSNSADQALLRGLRLSAPKSICSPSFARAAVVFDKDRETKPAKVKQETPSKNEVVEEKALREAAKKAKKEAKKEKKRKREHNDDS
jgi:hypothetical protein